MDDLFDDSSDAVSPCDEVKNVMKDLNPQDPPPPKQLGYSASFSRCLLLLTLVVFCICNIHHTCFSSFISFFNFHGIN